MTLGNGTFVVSVWHGLGTCGVAVGRPRRACAVKEFYMHMATGCIYAPALV